MSDGSVGDIVRGAGNTGSQSIGSGNEGLHNPVSALATRSEPSNGSGIGGNANPDEHALLSRPAAPQGRRSLFRR